MPEEEVIKFGYEKQITIGIGGFADVHITEMGVIRKRAEEIMKECGINVMDALHIAVAGMM